MFRSLSSSRLLCLVSTLLAWVIVFPLYGEDTLLGTTTSRLNVRSGPSTSHRVVRVMSRQVDVTVFEQKGLWCRISSAGKQSQWVHQKYLKIRRVASREDLNYIAQLPVRSADTWKTPWVGELTRTLSEEIYAGCPVRVVRSNDDSTYTVRPYPHAIGYEDLPPVFSVPKDAVRPLFNRARVTIPSEADKDSQMVNFLRFKDSSARMAFFHTVKPDDESNIVLHDGQLRALDKSLGRTSSASVFWDSTNHTYWMGASFYSNIVVLSPRLSTQLAGLEQHS